MLFEREREKGDTYQDLILSLSFKRPMVSRAPPPPGPTGQICEASDSDKGQEDVDLGQADRTRLASFLLLVNLPAEILGPVVGALASPMSTRSLT